MLSILICYIEKLKKKFFEGINSKVFGFFFKLLWFIFMNI